MTRDTTVSLKPATTPPSKRALLVTEVGKYAGGASKDGWCGCFITYIKQHDRPLEVIADTALDSGEYTAVYLYEVNTTAVSHFLVGEREEDGSSTFYELSGFSDETMRGAFRLAMNHPVRSFTPRLSGDNAVLVAILLLLLSCFLAGATDNPLFFLSPLIMIPVYYIAWFYSLDAHQRKLKSLAVDALPPVVT